MAKEYILKTDRPEDPTPAFVRRMATWAKATNEITGLIRGLLADGRLDKTESDFIRAWISSNSMLLYDPLVRVLAARIARVYADGIVTDEELAELKLVITEYADGDNKPTTLPLDDPMPVIEIRGKNFVSQARSSPARAHGARSRLQFAAGFRWIE